MYERRVLSADAESTWVAIGGVLLRRAPSGWSIWVAKSTVDRLKDERRRNRAPVLATLPWIGAGATLAVVAPKFWSDALAVPYPRALGETLLGWTVGTFGHWPIIQNGPWDGFGRGAVLLTFGLLLNTGIATVATITPELFFTDKGDPFPVGGAVLGAATGYVGGAILDLVLDRLGIESEFGRAALWSSFTAVGAPLGFHLMRGPRGAD